MLLLSDEQYVLRDTAKNTSAKDKSTFILVPKRDDQLLSDKSVNLAAGGGAEALEEESGMAGKWILIAQWWCVVLYIIEHYKYLCTHILLRL